MNVEWLLCHALDLLNLACLKWTTQTKVYCTHSCKLRKQLCARVHRPIQTLWAMLHCVFNYYYMASSASGQDDPNRAMWLATRAGKIEPSCPLGTTRCIPQEELPGKPHNKSFIDQVCLVKIAGYWPRSFFASLLTSTSSRSINTQKKNLANIQPSWPHTWSITHTFNLQAQ